MKKNKDNDGFEIGRISRTDTIEFVVFITEHKGEQVVRMGLQFVNATTGERKPGATVKIFKGELRKIRKYLKEATAHFDDYEGLKANVPGRNKAKS